MRELFIEELDAVRGGGNGTVDTTTACCEEGPFGCCGTLDPVWDLIDRLR